MAKGKKIDFGAKPEKPAMVMDAKKEPTVFYPTLHVGNIEGVADLPSGEFDFTGRGKVVHKSVSERNGKKSYSCEIEVHHMTPTKADGSEDEGGLDKALEDIESQKTGKSTKDIEADEDEDAADMGADEATEKT